MASKIDVSALTLSAEEAQEVSALILENEFVNGILSEDHEIETGIEHNKQIVFAGKIVDSLKVAAGCTPNAGGTLGFTEKFWTPKKYDSRFQHCADDVNSLLKIFRKAQKINPDFYDRVDSEELGLVGARIGMMIRETLPVKVWFSDTAAALHSGAGVFSTGTDLDLYNVIDGLWKQIFAEITPSSDNFVNIAANEGATYVLQALAVDEAYDTFEAMVNAADERLIADGGAKILCTRSMADNYRNSLRSKTLSAGFIEVTENGKPQLFFDGIPVSIRYDWDRTIKSAQDNGTVWNLPHRAVLTTKENIPVGTLSDTDFDTLDSFYDRTLKSNIMDVAFTLDAKFLESYMAVAAY